MMNTELKNTLRKYLGTDLSKENLETITYTLNEVLDEIRAEQEKAEKAINKAKDADHIVEVMHNYVLNHYDLSDELRAEIEENGMFDREIIDRFFDMLISTLELFFKAADKDTDTPHLDDLTDLIEKLTKSITNTSTITDELVTNIAPSKSCAFGGTAQINSDALAKFASKFSF